MIPVLNVYGQVSEMYIRLKKEATVNLTLSGTWPLLLKTVGLPLSDKIFVERQQHRLVRVASNTAHNLYTKVEKLLEARREMMAALMDDDDDPFSGMTIVMGDSPFSSGQSVTFTIG